MEALAAWHQQQHVVNDNCLLRYQQQQHHVAL